jgi:shikimate dehydrogenase
VIDGKTQLIGLIGYPISHSFSPAMHNAAARDLGLNWAYVPLAVPPDRVGDAVRGLPAFSFHGANVTIPHKQAVMPYLDHIDPAAHAIGAVNTIVVEGDGKLVGYNTDWSGFGEDLASYGVDMARQTCAVLGAGGSARAIVYALTQAGAEVNIFARRIAQAEQLVTDLDVAHLATSHTFTDLTQHAARITLLINTTPIGMFPYSDQSPLPDGLILPNVKFVYDLVYNPAQTKLMVWAEKASNDVPIPHTNGLGMLLRQGAQAFKLWTGQQPNLQVMAQAIGKNWTA